MLAGSWLLATTAAASAALPPPCALTAGACCSREKVRLTDELKRAELQVARCKEVIRQAARYCDEVPPGGWLGLADWGSGTMRAEIAPACLAC